MLEIIALIFLSREIGKIAERKGLKPGKWKLYMVLVWFGAEIIGWVIALSLFPGSIMSAMAMGLGFAVTSYFHIKSILNKKPDSFEADIEQIGRDTPL